MCCRGWLSIHRFCWACQYFFIQLVGDIHVEVVDVIPGEVERFLLLVDINRKPDVPAFPEGVGIPLYSLPSIHPAKDKLT
jgi:hypothetical protein